jgi:hypothetical protein
MQKLLLENLLTRIFWLFRTDTCGVQWLEFVHLMLYLVTSAYTRGLSLTYKTPRIRGSYRQVRRRYYQLS